MSVPDSFRTEVWGVSAVWVLDPDYLPITGFWEGVVQDLTSRGALAAFAILVSLSVAIRQMREQAREAMQIGEQVRADYESALRQSSG